ETAAVQPVLTSSAGYLSAPRGFPISAVDYQYYLAGVIDAFKLFVRETVAISDAQTPPVLPSDVEPISIEVWNEMAETGDRFAYGAKLAMERLLQGILSPLSDGDPLLE